jgi:putative membrane protein
MHRSTASFFIGGTLLALATVLVAQAPSAGPPNLTDPEVAHVAVTANTIDIDLARFAQTRTANAEVRRFAATMISDHSGVNQQAVALAGRLGVAPADNAVSKSLLQGASDARRVLEGARGAAFDRAYMDREIAYHQAVLDALDGLLIPTTENAELKKLLSDVRPAIAAHLEHAKQLRNALGGTSSGD